MTSRHKGSSSKLSQDLEGSYTVFKDIVNTIKTFLDEMKMRVDQMTQETGYFVSLVENNPNFMKDYPEIVPRIKENIRTYSGMALACTSIPENYLLTAHSIDTLINKLLKKLDKSIKESSYLYFILDDYVTKEKSRIEYLVKDRLIACNEYATNLVWDEDPFKIARKGNFGATDPQIFFTDKIESNSNVFSPVIKECLVSSMDKQFTCGKSPTHVKEQFENIAQILANFNNMKKSTLYIKLSFESTLNVLNNIIEQIRVKHFFYQCSAKEYSKFAMNLWDESKYIQSFDKICVSASQIELELKKLGNQFSACVPQLNSIQKTCIPLANIFFSGSTVEKFKKVAKRGHDIISLVEGLFECREDAVTKENRSFSIAPQMKSKSIEDIEYSRFNKQIRYKSSLKLRPKEAKKTPEYHIRIESLLTYQIIHLKSVLLKKLQPQRIIAELIKAREQLSQTMKQFCENDSYLKREWDAKVRLLNIKMFDIHSMENKVKFSYSLNQYGCHSYNSSWDLEQVDRHTADIHTANSQGSRSDSMSEQSESELSEDGGVQDSFKRARVVDWKNKIYSKIKDRFAKPANRFTPAAFDTAMNTLNKKSKEIHSSGLYGWKTQLKRLRHNEDKLKIRSHKAKVLYKVQSEYHRLKIESPNPVTILSRGSPNRITVPPINPPSPNNPSQQYLTPSESLLTPAKPQILYQPATNDKDSYTILECKPIETVLTPSEPTLLKSNFSSTGASNRLTINIIPKKVLRSKIPKPGYEEYDIIEKVKQYNLKSNIESNLKGILETFPKAKSPVRENSRKLNKQIENQLNLLSPDKRLKKPLEQRTILAISKYSSGLLKHRINVIRKDRSLDPVEKISKVREEFELDNRSRSQGRSFGLNRYKR